MDIAIIICLFGSVIAPFTVNRKINLHVFFSALALLLFLYKTLKA